MTGEVTFSLPYWKSILQNLPPPLNCESLSDASGIWQRVPINWPNERVGDFWGKIQLAGNTVHPWAIFSLDTAVLYLTESHTATEHTEYQCQNHCHRPEHLSA